MKRVLMSRKHAVANLLPAADASSRKHREKPQRVPLPSFGISAVYNSTALSRQVFDLPPRENHCYLFPILLDRS
jgi:hypothetical protein